MTRKKRRDLTLITDELHSELAREATSFIAIGALLTEARGQLNHGEWLPWLEEHFSESTSTAENYMAAARFAAKFPIVTNLKLRPTALYRLGRALDDLDDPFNDRKTIKAILKAAETGWVSVHRAHTIADALRPPEPEPSPAGVETEADELQDDVEEILAGPPPELPPAPEATVHDVILPSFDQAVATLAHLQTKPMASFVATTHDPDRISDVIIFLQEVAVAIQNRKAAA
ncbi:hypothetical protein ACH79_42095 [Bradyrhizobium sp. CCBAU 051011]|uniref:DUF3102 domain-containing protein n=1 Tax=Bradyrhizobium sp. CCBAU 051011 TaxID=858422 RepID=UPI001373DA37|nr:DUF3102 domain-containing protein [Bradyrhizobium sp. CCBAU 051011]QHO78200.1 hypothetical protein ACH79_42095 [Bradyrhizobium sp. CCBAU 051011]